MPLGGGLRRDAIYIGREVLPDWRGGNRVTYGGPLHHILVGPNGVGKGMRVLAPNLLTMEDKSIVVMDPKGQLAAMTANFRQQVSDVRIIDPFGVLKELTSKYPAEFAPLIEAGLVESVGFNPLASLDPDSNTFYDNAAVISDAMIKIQGKEPHWTESAQGLATGLIMWERLKAGKKASLEHVRFMLTEADRFGEFVGLDGKLHKRKIAGATERTNNEMEGVRSTADTQTRWLLSQPVSADLKKNGVDFSLLKTGARPMTVYIVLPSDRLEDHSIWLRLVVSDALRACMTAGGRRVLFMLDEFAALGHLSIIQKLFSVTRDYRVQLMPVLQGLEQLSKLYPDRWNTMLGSAGVVQSFRATDKVTAEWFSKRSPPRTVTALGYNEGSGLTQSGMNSNSGLNFNQIEKPTIQPHQMFGMPDNQSIAYFMGCANPGIFVMPHLKQMKLQWARALKNPYYHD
jgi:type IV secretion system protein VirD4